MFKFGRVTLALCLWVGHGLVSTDAGANETVKSNLTVAREMTLEIATELVSGFPDTISTRDIQLAPFGNDERYEFIANMLTDALTSRGYRAHMPVRPVVADSAATATPATAAIRDALRLDFTAIDFRVRYTKIYRSFLIGGRTVKREADVRVFARLINPTDGLVVWSGESARSFEDQFPHGDLDSVEEGLYQFTKPPRNSRNWGRIVEPVVVGGIIVGLIYLFFSNQGS
jgi:TolB-like protein